MRLGGSGQALNQRLLEPSVQQDHQRLQELCLEIQLKEAQVERLYLRFAELDAKLAGA